MMHSSRLRTARFSGRLGRGCLPGDVSTWGMSAQDTPPTPVNRITDRCKKIAVPELPLHAVIVANNMYDSLKENKLTLRPARHCLSFIKWVAVFTHALDPIK